MFFPASAPPDCDVQGLRGLRRSLNTPVVAIDLLPSGPASAAIALQHGSDDAPQVTIALRATRSGQLAFFSADEKRAQFGSPGVAMDAALSFAESMGFLFDDDEVEGEGEAGSTQAAQIWRDFVSTDAPAVVSRRAPNEVLLEEIEVLEQAPAPVEIEARSADLTDSIPDAVPPAVPPAVGVLLGRAPFEADEQAEAPFDPVLDLALVLTKFRRGSEASIAAEPPSERHDTQIQVMSRF
jgi:hypothetical protein